MTRLLSARDAEKLLGIPAATIRSWHRRHHATGLYPTGLDPRGHPLFAEYDLIRLRQGETLRHPDGTRSDPA